MRCSGAHTHKPRAGAAELYISWQKTTAMKLPLYQIDAFTGRMFGGNPAAVVLWMPGCLTTH